MPGVVYSAALLEDEGLTGSLTFDVPPGYYAVLRDVSAYQGGALASKLLVKANLSGASFIGFFVTAAAPQSSQWKGRQVFETGDGFTVESDGNPWDFRASGYLLKLP